MSRFGVVILLAALFLLFAAVVHAEGEEEEDEDLVLYREICRARRGDDYFRLATGRENCRDFYACSPGVEDQVEVHRCPDNLFYDVDRQICEWPGSVTNCDQIVRSGKTFSSLVTFSDDDKDRGKCSSGAVASCDNGTTCLLSRDEVCDGDVDCRDRADESGCGVGGDPFGAPECEDLDSSCHLPDCFCTKTGTLPPSTTTTHIEEEHSILDVVESLPQLVVISFAEVVNVESFRVFQDIFDPSKRRNPNGCSLKGTFFVPHEFTNYSLVNELYHLGHEIASNTVSNDKDANFWRVASRSVWLNESLGQRRILSAHADIPLDQLVGFRSPLLRLGGNRHFGALSEAGFAYDASVVVPLHEDEVPLFPYTLHARIPHPCHGFEQVCPTKAFPALWELPINELLVSSKKNKKKCPAIDRQCGITDAAEIYETLAFNFMRHYHTNRAPFGVHLDTELLRQDRSLVEAVHQFLDDVLREHGEDVYFVTMSDALGWMREPKTTEEVAFLRGWYRGSCRWLHTVAKKDKKKKKPCKSKRCELRSLTFRPWETHFLDTCAEKCPNGYPWVDDIEGSRMWS